MCGGSGRTHRTSCIQQTRGWSSRRRSSSRCTLGSAFRRRTGPTLLVPTSRAVRHGCDLDSLDLKVFLDRDHTQEPRKVP